MEDQNIRDLFKNFDPDLSSGSLFVSDLQHKLDTVEYIRQANEHVMRRNRRAVWLAAFAGCAVGIILSWAVPYIHSLISALTHAHAYRFFTFSIDPDSYILSWVIVAAASIFSALTVYNLAQPLPQKSRS